MRFHLPDGLLKRADADVSDLTGAKRSGEPYWDANEPDMLVVPMEGQPTAAERAEIRRRLVTTDDIDEQRLHDLLTARAEASSLFERLWLDTELAKYGETWVAPTATKAVAATPATPAPGRKK